MKYKRNILVIIIITFIVLNKNIPGIIDQRNFDSLEFIGLDIWVYPTLDDDEINEIMFFSEDSMNNASMKILILSWNLSKEISYVINMSILIKNEGFINYNLKVYLNNKVSKFRISYNVPSSKLGAIPSRYNNWIDLIFLDQIPQDLHNLTIIFLKV